MEGGYPMLITQLIKVKKTGLKVFIDEEYAFLLSEDELDKYNLKEGDNITMELYEELRDKVVYPRAIQKALSLLKFMERCEQELRSKLVQEAYPQEVVDRVIDYVYHYGYLDDKRFASGFVRSRKNRKSKLMIKTELLQKGVARELIDLVLQEEYEGEESEDAELTAIQKAIAKKTGNPSALSPEDKQKLIASLYRKGFDLSKIKQLL